MLRELSDVRQHAGEYPRRWFADAYFDLIVWNDEEGEVFHFQLSYDKRRRERLLEWKSGVGLSHFRVDSAQDRPARYARTPVLVPEDPDDVSLVADRFESESGQIDAHIAHMVVTRLRGASGQG